MAKSPNLGYAAAAGIEGGYKALHEIIARRKLDEDRALAQQEMVRRANMEQARFMEAQRAAEVQEQRLGEQTTSLNALRQEQSANFKRDDERARLTLEKTERDKAEMIAKIQNDPNIPDFNKKMLIFGIQSGKGFDPGDLTAQKPMTREEALADFEQRERIKAKYDKTGAGGAGAAPGYYTPHTSTIGPYGSLSFNHRTGTWEAPRFNFGEQGQGGNAQAAAASAAFGAPLPGGIGGQMGVPEGMVGAASKKSLDKAMVFNETLTNLDTLEAIGDRNNWTRESHTGPLGPLKTKMAEWGVIDDPQGSAVRSATQYVKTLIGHPLFGSAFTAGEQKALNAFAGGVDVVGQENKNRIGTMREIITNARDRWLQGPGAGTAGTASGAANDPFGALSILELEGGK